MKRFLFAALLMSTAPAMASQPFLSDKSDGSLEVRSPLARARHHHVAAPKISQSTAASGRRFTLPAAKAAAPPPLAPSDPFFPQQWSLHNDGSQLVVYDTDAENFHTILQSGVPGADIGWLDAKAEFMTRATSPVIVAVIDSGFDKNHPDLQGRYTSDAHDFLNVALIPSLPPPFPMDTMGHGTHVSGIIAANADNGEGIAGIAPPSIQILPLRILSNDFINFSFVDPVTKKNKLISDFAADAVRYAVAHHASIINLSLGWPKLVDTANVRQAFQEAIQAGVLIVVAAGNDRKDQPTYPCAYEGVLCVGSMTNTGAMAIYSNLGGMVDILAPGDGIVSTYPTQLEPEMLRIQGYELMSGTSQASPQIAAIAAVIKSANPNLSLNELKARIFSSASKLPSADAALFGLVNLKNALDAKPQTVFFPDFKAVDEIAVDENSLQIQGQLSVRNLWLAASGVQAKILVNGQIAGTASTASLASGADLSIPWTYKFSSLDDSSLVHLVLQISDTAGDSKEFSVGFPAVRAMTNIKGIQNIPVPGVKPEDWICTNNGHLYSTLSLVDSYPKTSGLPRFYRQMGDCVSQQWGSDGSLVQIYDPLNIPSPVNTIQVPGIRRIEQIIRIDAKGDGNLDWLITGFDNDPFSPGHVPSAFVFYFLDSKFQPLFGSIPASQWVVRGLYDSTSGQFNSFGQNVAKNYASPNSWMRANGQLVPCFLGSGWLPTQDNFSSLDPRHNATADMHLYYLAPQPQAKPENPVALTIRALDNATFRQKYPGVHLENLIPASGSDETAGHIRVLFDVGQDLDAKNSIWDLRSITDSSVGPAPGWDSLSSNGTPFQALSSGSAGNSSAFLSFFDYERGSLAWADLLGQFIDRTEFSFYSPENPITGLIGTFNLPSLGRYWFLESGFDLVGYHQPVAGGSTIETHTFPIERDSSFPLEEFSQMFTPVLVGTPANPLPGVYIDSTLVRGNQVAVAVWNPTSGALEKPLRYSTQIPDSCVEMSPIQLTTDAESFALPLLCQKDTQVVLEVVQPGN